MSNSYRIRTQVGVDKSIKLLLDQDFEQLEILSLKILSSQIYNRQCSDYGVVIGRISANDGFGLPNCKVSVFVPLSAEDENNPVISELYPYKTLSDVNVDGYRYNLLPYTKSYSAHVATGSFPDREDALVDTNVIEVYDKYYKFTTQTNDSGDYMLFGVPLGSQTIHVDIDLSDIGEFSLSPQDLIRMGVATEAQVAGVNFKASTNLNSLPQIVSFNRTINVDPFWGQPEVCSVGITRTDFDITGEANISITPTAIFMGSMFSDADSLALKRNCKPKFAQGELCSLVAGPGEILAIRQTIFNDAQGLPILEQFDLESGGQVIDENGAWLVDVPMNLDYVTTNEFGDRVLSNDPKVGVPTRGKYRFKVKWNQSPNLSENVKRAYFLVPNVREYGWTSTGTDPSDTISQKKSYAFSLDWNDYVDPQTAINCEDTFYKFSYNKVYTVSQLIDQYRNGTLANRIISVKNILDNTCESENNKFPTNDSSFRWDFIFLLFTFTSYIFRPILISLVFLLHILFFLIILIRTILIPLIITYLSALLFIALPIEIAGAAAGVVSAGMVLGFIAEGVALVIAIAALIALNVQMFKMKLKGVNIPLLLYDQCEFCSCEDGGDLTDDGEFQNSGSEVSQTQPPPPLPNASGVQITNLEGGSYNSDLLIDNFSYIYINRLLSGYYVQYPPSKTVCYSKLPVEYTGRYDPPGSTYDEQPATYFTRSLTLAERLNLFNTKSKYFNETIDNPGGGVNQVYVSVEPTLNGGGYNSPGGKYHTDNVIVMMMTADSLQYLPIGSLLSFVSPNSTYDKNYTGATLNQYGTNSITGSSLYDLTTPGATTFPITVNYVKPDGTSDSVVYNVTPPTTADTNFHKFPTDIEYFQVITAMTYNQFSGLTNTLGSPNYNVAQFLPNHLNYRYLDNDMRINIHYKFSNSVNDFYENINPLTSLSDYGNQVIVILNRGVDPYSSRVQTRFDLGKIFGFTDPTAVQVQDNFKLNIPINGGFLNVNHNLQNFDAQSQDTYSNMYLYHNSYNYVPSSTQYSGFASNLITYYSSLDNTTPLNYWPNCQKGDGCSGNEIGVVSNKGLNVGGLQLVLSSSSAPSPDIFRNEFILEYNQLFNAGIFDWYVTDMTSPNSVSNNQNRGYFSGEIVEGASLMTITSRIAVVGGQYAANVPPASLIYNSSGWEVGKYVAPKYPSNLFLNFTLGTNSPNNRQIVMRSDRLPTSDRQLNNCENSFSLQQNQNLGIYVIPDVGALNVPQNSAAPIGPQVTETDSLPPNFTSQLLATTNSCADSRNLECYDFIPNRTLRDGTNPGGGDYIINSGGCQEYNNKKIFDKGCYKLITSVFISLPKDILLVNEWLSRTSITFGACRNVFSHLFTQNWINGGLYAFAFKNNRLFDQNNVAFSQYCSAVIYFDSSTNNFYYRSSPYVTGTTNSYFVGRNAPTLPNRRNLLYPTTIMDLGPRTDYLQELVFSDEYDGYVVNKIKSTSFQDVSELLNLLIITRLANTSFINIIIGGGGASIFNYFTRVPLLDVNQRLNVDADYAQMISINSELGVVPFEADAYPNYPAPPAPQVVIDPVYFNTGNQKNTVFGVFYSSDTQVRDYITPKRTIINSQVPFNNPCAFNNFYCYSQDVPFYQWEIKQNTSLDSIFGSQTNDWYTLPVDGSGFQHSPYQSMDRGDSASRYFRTNTGIAGDYKGYIYSIDNGGVGSPFWVTPSLNPLPGSQDFNNPYPRTVTVGAPFYFYFGLKKGKSAWDRFAKKWINFENITE